MRSLLFVPADSERKIAKALASGADAVILDLEDSVALAAKPAARSLVTSTLRARGKGQKILVRINALASGLAEDDIAAIGDAAPDGLVLPKAEGGADVKRLLAMADIPVIAIATETARAMFELGTYDDCGGRLLGLTWGMEDLAAALGAQSNRDETGQPTEPYRLARSLCLIGARAAGVAPIDGVHVNFRDAAGLERQCREAVRDGFTAKLCIHPDQVAIINQVFTPSPEAVARARRIVKAFADAGHAGVIGLDGEMLDVPHLRAAQALLARAGE
jgi:citrate lyase subunit beta/citryl-CoA lyase